jgi:hypothetical protein
MVGYPFNGDVGGEAGTLIRNPCPAGGRLK